MFYHDKNFSTKYGSTNPIHTLPKPFNKPWVALNRTAGAVVSSGSLAAGMFSNVNAEATSRVLATRLYEMTDVTLTPTNPRLARIAGGRKAHRWTDGVSSMSSRPSLTVRNRN